MKLLHVDASILGEGSVSRQVSARVVSSLIKAGGPIKVSYRDLAADPLPHLTPANLPGAHPLSALSPEANAERAASEAILDEFLAADTVVIGAPMYNFGVPSQLKAWIDRLLVPGKTFSYGENGPVGLAKGKRVILALSRGGAYGPHNAGAEHAEAWLRTVFGFIGVEPEVIVAEGINHGPDARAKAVDGALETALKLAA
ncbi:MAG TPA: FMN-dependent NADH-azoreductase [Caulobacteraceae bacterium]